MSVVNFFVIFVVAVMIYVRRAPSEAARWHIDLSITEDEILKGGAKRLVAVDLAELHSIALQEERTVVLAGDISSGKITYITRTKWMGFPDYTTVQQSDKGVMIFGRLRYGRSDFGVNAARIDRWIAALSAG